MGHVTVLSNEKQDLIHKANKIKQLLSVVSSTVEQSQSS
jgi:5-(carboxyamino)imidazole ribonucleotide synthase